VFVRTFEGTSLADVSSQMDAWLRDPKNRSKRVLGVPAITRDTANYETFGGRGAQAFYVATVSYVFP
jgi:hypothetical protein